jgi:hypothetical protein
MQLYGIITCSLRFTCWYRNRLLHCKKELAVFPSPAGMSLIKLFLGGNNFVFSRPERVWSVTSRLGTGKWLTLFYSVILSRQAETERSILQENNMLNMNISLNRHGPGLIPNIRHFLVPPYFSLLSTFQGLGEWRWMTVLYQCINVIRNACIEKDKIK